MTQNAGLVEAGVCISGAGRFAAAHDHRELGAADADSEDAP
jgi:hypothetical protein